MTQIERELGLQLEGLLASLDAGSPGPAARRYIGAALDEWGFTVEPPEREVAAAPAAWSVVGRLGLDLPGRVQLLAHLDDPGGAATAAVVLALGHLLAQYQLRHGLDLILLAGPAAPPRVTPGERLVAAVCFAGSWRTTAAMRVDASCVSHALAQGVSRLLARYPRAVWIGPEARPQACAPCIGVSGAHQGEGLPGVGAGTPAGDAAPSPDRMREALMLGAEIVALLQAWAPGSCAAAAP